MDEATTSRESYVRRPGRRKLFNYKRPGSLDTEKVTRYARKSTTPKAADEKPNESNSWHEIGRTGDARSQASHADALKRSEESGDRCKKYEYGSDIRQYGEKGT